MSYKVITGIGSRKPTLQAWCRMWNLGYFCAANNIVARSGGADGCDNAFAEGYKTYCKLHNKESMLAEYLPWKGFNKVASADRFCKPSEEAYELALQFHPKPDLLRSRDSIWSLMARNAHQVLGLNLDRAADLIVCWCKYLWIKEYDDEGNFVKYIKKYDGGTGQALRMADFYQIPVINLYDEYPGMNDLYCLARTFLKLDLGE